MNIRRERQNRILSLHGCINRKNEETMAGRRRCEEEQVQLQLHVGKRYQTAMSSILFSDVGLHVVPLSLTNTTLLSI